MQGNRGATGQKTLVRTCTKLSSNESRRQGDYTVEPASANTIINQTLKSETMKREHAC